MNKYMHTIDGKAAYFDGEQICFVRDGMKLSRLFVDSLDLIRRQQKATKKYRAKHRFDDLGPYNYIRVKA